MPSLAEVEEWIESQWPDSLRELPQQVTDKAHEYYTALYHELVRYGPPPIQDLTEGVKGQLNNLKEFVNPTPPPPPVPEVQVGAAEAALGWAKSHPITIVAGLTATSVGLGLAYARVYPDSARSLAQKAKNKFNRAPVRRPARIRNGIRREAVIVLGADTPLGRAMLIGLTSQGLIVIAAVSNTTSLNSFDGHLLPSSRGYVAVRHFDLTSLPGSIDEFVAEIKSTLSLRFPLNAPGDPFARPGDGAILIGIVNALSYVPDDAGVNSFSSASSAGASLQKSLSAHVTAPISAISALLPELRGGTKRVYSQNPEYLTPVTVITLVDGSAGQAKVDALPRLVAEGAASAASSLRQSACSVGTDSRASARSLRFTVLNLPAVQAGTTWTSKDALTHQVQATVLDMILSSDQRRTLPSTTYLPSSGTCSQTVCVPIIKLLKDAQLKLMSVLPVSVTQRLEALYRALSSLSLQVQHNVSWALGHRRKRLPGPHDGLRRGSSHSGAIVKRNDRAQGYDLNRHEVTPRPSYSAAPGELEAPSSLETGSSADDDDVLRSAPSSAFDEDEENIHSPWLGTSAPSQSQSTHYASSNPDSARQSDALSNSQTDSTPAASHHWGSTAGSASQPSLDQSWVQLGDSALRSSQQH